MGMGGKKKKNKKRKDNVKESYEREKANKPMGYTLHLQKVVKEKGKKLRNNPCITSLQSYERGEKHIQRPFHPHSPQDTKEKKPKTSHPLTQIYGWIV